MHKFLNNTKSTLKITDKYQTELDLVRQNRKLLDNYRFDKNALNSKHFERLRLNIAIYNDFKQSDYDIVKFLFTEEKEWRKYAEDGEVDNLYFCAFILTLFNSPEIIWSFFETKNIDFDSGIGFDGEFLVSAGIKETYLYLKTVDNPIKTELLKYIGETEDNCIFSQAEINDWKENKKSYFRCNKYPIQDELYFLFSTNERELFLTKFPEWIKQERAWTYEELGSYRTYSKYSNDKSLEIEALKLTLEKNDKDFLTEIFNLQLATLYVEIGENEKAYEILEKEIKETDNKNTVRDCVEQLCRLIIRTNNAKDYSSQKSYSIIKVQQKKYTNFSKMVDNLIMDVSEIMNVEIFTPNNSTLPKSGRSWWQKLLGSE